MELPTVSGAVDIKQETFYTDLDPSPFLLPDSEEIVSHSKDRIKLKKIYYSPRRLRL